jgi:hypothetical protein
MEFRVSTSAIELVLVIDFDRFGSECVKECEQLNEA